MTSYKLNNYIQFVGHIGAYQIDNVRLLANRRTIYCFGDSHVQMLYYIHQHRLLQKTYLRMKCIRGATAMGMVNPHSHTNALQAFQRRIRFISPRHHLLFMLGRADCGLVIWYRAAKHGLSVESQFEQSLSNYRCFLSGLLARGYRHIILSSVPLPIQVDAQAGGAAARARRQVTATIREQTDLTLAYNDCLRSFCREQNILFLDYEADTLDPSTRLLNEHFRSPNPLDIHLSRSAAAPVLVGKLNDLGFL